MCMVELFWQQQITSDHAGCVIWPWGYHSSEWVSLLSTETLVALRSLCSDETNRHFCKKQTVRGPRVCPPAPLQTELHSLLPTADSENTETHGASERFQVALCLNIAVTQGEISVVDLKSAGKSAGQFNGHCFTQGGAFRGWKVVFPSSDASSALKATTIIQGAGMWGILLFSANLCGNQRSLAVSGVVFIKVTV